MVRRLEEQGGNKAQHIERFKMLKRLIALAVASTALVLAVSDESSTQVRNSPKLDEDYIVYRHVFAHIYFEAHRKEKPNQDVNPAIEYFKQTVPLSEDEANVLAKIALESESRTLAIEEQAATIISRYREKIEVEFRSGRKLSREPPELQTLQQQRVSATLQGRDELRKAFGESTFSRFDKFLKEGMNLRIEKAIPSPQNN